MRKAGILVAASALALLAGCALEPYARADARGWEVGARGTWAGAAQAAGGLVHRPDAPVANDGKAVRP